MVPVSSSCSGPVTWHMPPSPCSLVVPVWSHTVSWGPLLSFTFNPMLVFLLLNLLQTALALKIFTLGSVNIWCIIFHCPRGCSEEICSRISGPSASCIAETQIPKTEILTLLSVSLGGVALCWEPLLCGKTVNPIETVHWNCVLSSILPVKNSHFIACHSASTQAPLWLSDFWRGTTDYVRWEIGVGYLLRSSHEEPTAMNNHISKGMKGILFWN